MKDDVPSYECLKITFSLVLSLLWRVNQWFLVFDSVVRLYCIIHCLVAVRFTTPAPPFHQNLSEVWRNLSSMIERREVCAGKWEAGKLIASSKCTALSQPAEIGLEGRHQLRKNQFEFPSPSPNGKSNRSTHYKLSSPLTVSLRKAISLGGWGTKPAITFHACLKRKRTLCDSMENVKHGVALSLPIIPAHNKAASSQRKKRLRALS